jgi:hypothetical protein
MMVFLLEERSMEVVLRSFLPKLIPGWQEGVDFLFVKHEGKADLEKSIPRKLRAWTPSATFVIVRDNDGGDCVALKKRLLDLANGHERHRVLVRIVCQNLESWYLGDPLAVSLAYTKPSIAKHTHKKEFQNPDAYGNGDQILLRHIPEFSKGKGALLIGPHLDPTRSTSRSFKMFCSGVKKMKECVEHETMA